MEEKKTIKNKLATTTYENFKTFPSDYAKEIVGYLCKGLRAKEIAAKVGLSKRTVETDLYSLSQLFDAKSQAHLVGIFKDKKFI